MKKINFTPKVKKGIMIAGISLISIGVIVIASVLTAQSEVKAEPQVVDTSSAILVTDNSNVSVSPIEDNSNASSQAPAFVPSSGASQTTELTKIEKPTSTPPTPVIEGDSSKTSDGKETQPTNSALTDKNHEPTYTSQPTAPKPSKPAPTKPSTSQPAKNKPSKPANSTPSGGKAGQVYDPVFGWQYPTGGEGTTVGNPGDELTGNKVGIMD